MKRNHTSFNSFPDLETFIDVFIVLAIIYGVPFLIGYFGCNFLFNGSAEDCKTWGYLFMVLTPIAVYLLSRILYILGITRDNH